jgi:uncharacterized protein YbaA (DUF1428 family)
MFAKNDVQTQGFAWNFIGAKRACKKRDCFIAKGADMAQYIDGFAFPISRARLDEYKRVAEVVAEIYKEHGALDYLEFVGDDLNREGTHSFSDALSSAEGEVIVFGWVVFESRESRDVVNGKVEADPRMAELVAPLMDKSDPIFNASRMAYGGFRALVTSAGTHSE